MIVYQHVDKLIEATSKRGNLRAWGSSQMQPSPMSVRNKKLKLIKAAKWIDNNKKKDASLQKKHMQLLSLHCNVCSIMNQRFCFIKVYMNTRTAIRIGYHSSDVVIALISQGI